MGDHDRIDLTVRVRAGVDEAWRLVGEPGWFINTGRLTRHTVRWEGTERVEVTDPDLGSYTFVVEIHEPPTVTAYRGLDVDGQGGSRRVELRVTPADGDSVDVRVVESGFAGMAIPEPEQVAQYEQNVRTWTEQLELAREHLESEG